MSSRPLILLVEDDPSLGALIVEGLQDKGYEIIWQKEGLSGEETFVESGIDLCILDVMLPDIDGFELAHRIRCRDKHVPILFLSARNLPEDRIKGFNQGADDYITKPFSMQELDLRIQVFLRRTQVNSSTEPFSGSNWSFEPGKLCLTVDGNLSKLTLRESDLLNLLLSKANSIQERESILQELWGDNDYFMGRSLDVFISRLRKRIAYAKGLEIVNHHGIGFSAQLEV